MGKTRKIKKKRIALIGLVFLAILIAAWIIWGNVTIGISVYSIQKDRVPKEFEGFRITVVSDLHNARFGEDNKTLLSKIISTNPDVIVITGDLIDSNRTDIDVAVNFAKDMTSVAPCYFVKGNHEDWVGELYGELEKGLLNAGVTLLNDKSEAIEKNGERILLAGMADKEYSIRELYVPHQILDPNEDGNMFTVLLSHRPEAFEAYVAEHVDIALTGHAHGGQFRLPFVGGLVAPNQGIFPKYDGGLYEEGDTEMIVSRGIGNSIIPVRINNRPEIVVVELHSK